MVVFYIVILWESRLLRCTYPDIIAMIYERNLTPSTFSAFHSDPRTLDLLNPEKDSNYFGDEPDILIFSLRLFIMRRTVPQSMIGIRRS